MTRKYKNKPTVVDGLRFDSMREAARWRELKLLERGRQITDLKRQVPFVLAKGVKFEGAKRAKPDLRIIVDFFYHEAGFRVVEDVKSPATMKTAAFVIKRHLLKAHYGLDIRIVR